MRNLHDQQYILHVFSNKTHFETALPILNALNDQYAHIAIFNLSNLNYSKGLEKYLEEYKSLFHDTLVLGSTKSKFDRGIQLLKVKQFIKTILKRHKIQASLQFIEGGDIDWLVIGILKEHNIKTVVLQWAITWEPMYYDRLRQNKSRISYVRSSIGKFVKTLLGINYPSMNYLGDGQADYLLTMGEFWTNQFLKYHNYPHKFIATGNPRFLDLIDLKKYSDKKDILFITGAGTSLYGYSKNDHLRDIDEVYLAYESSQITNKLIHKIHPRDKYKDEIFNLSKKYKNIIVETEQSTTELLKTVLLTIVIRSTVGLEALVAGSKLIVYNNKKQPIGFNYAKYRLAQESQNVEELSYLLKCLNRIDTPAEDMIEYYLKTRNILEDIRNVIEN